MTIAHNQGGPCIELERSLPSEVAAISPFVDRLMVLLRECGCVSQSEGDLEIALREALANAIIHGNHENPQKQVYVRYRCEPDEVSLAVTDEGRGFDIKLRWRILNAEYSQATRSAQRFHSHAC